MENMDIKDEISKLSSEFSNLYDEAADKNFLRIYDCFDKGELPPFPPLNIVSYLLTKDVEQIRDDIKTDWDKDIYAKIKDGLTGIVSSMKKHEVFTPVISSNYGVNTIPSVFVEIVTLQDFPGGHSKRDLGHEEILDFDEKEAAHKGFIPQIREDIGVILEDALEKIKETGRDILLSCGQELHEKWKELETIKSFLLHLKKYPRLIFGFCVMHWGKQDTSLLETLRKDVSDFYTRDILEVIK